MDNKVAHEHHHNYCRAKTAPTFTEEEGRARLRLILQLFFIKDNSKGYKLCTNMVSNSSFGEDRDSI